MEGLFKVNIDGKDAYLKFTMRMMERMDQLTKTREGSITFPKVALIYAALETHYWSAKIECPFTIDEIEIWADDLTSTDDGNKLLAQISEAFIESAVYKKLMNDAAEIEKKRLNGQTSTPLPLEN